MNEDESVKKSEPIITESTNSINVSSKPENNISRKDLVKIELIL